MKHFKKTALFLVLVLCLNMCIFAFGAGAVNSSDYSYTINDDGTATITGYIAFDEEVTIPETIDGYTVTAVGKEAFMNNSHMVTLTIPDSVTSLGTAPFYHCTALETVTLSENLVTIGDYAFNHCEALRSVNIPDSVTSIGYASFANCTALGAAVLGKNVESLGYGAFGWCTALESINIPGTVTDIGAVAFYQCAKLAEITLPEGITAIGDYTFGGCTSLAEITIPDSVTTIGDYAFSGCTGLSAVNYNCTKTNLAKMTIAATNDEIVSDTTGWTKVHTGKEVTTKKNVVAATCTTEGSYDEVISCSTCKEVISSKTVILDIDSTAHVDSDSNEICDICGKDISDITETENGCHWCYMKSHSSSYINIIYTVFDTIHHVFEALTNFTTVI